MTEMMVDDAQGIRITFGGYVLLFILQVAAFSFTGILVVLAGAFDTLSDVINSGFLLLAHHWSHLPPDKMYMFGYSRVQNVAALVAGTIFISYLSLEMFRQAITQMLNPQPPVIQNLPLAVGVTVIALGATTIPFMYLLWQKRREAAAQEQLVALLENGAAYSISLVSLFFVASGYLVADAIASFLIAILIALTGVYLLKDNIRFLIGVAPCPEYLEKIKRIVLSVDGVLGIHNLYAEYVSRHTFRIAFHVQVKKGTLVEEADRIIEMVKARVLQEA